MPSVKKKDPSKEDLVKRKTVNIGLETVTNTHSDDIPGHYPAENHTWSLRKFEENFQVIFYKNEPLDASFSLVGLDASVANAFRRILLAEVPTVAGEVIYMFNNTSVLHDEVLAQRLGLVPLTGASTGFDQLVWRGKADPDTGTEEDPALDSNTIIFKLQKECTLNPDADQTEADPQERYINAHVYARDLEWECVGRQAEWFPQPVRPANPDILLAKLRPGQCIDLEMHCVKGEGRDHAKFSPVATASYRLHPTIEILQPILGADAEKFAACFPKGVIALEPITTKEAKHDERYREHVGEQRAVVKNAFKDTVSRECLRHDEFKGKVKLGRIKDHFIFGIESTGQFDSDDLFLKAVTVLKAKCVKAKNDLDKLERHVAD